MNNWDSDARPDPNAESGVRESDGTTITPIEAMISEDSSRKLHRQAALAEEIAEERQKRASAPIHMEGLQPLPQGMPRMPNGVIPGGSDATTLVPSMRKTIPAPYKRPRIAIEHHGKTWAYAKAESVVKDDLVVDFGKIAEVQQRTNYDKIAGLKVAVGVDVVLINIMDEVKVFDPTEQVRVFRVHEEDK